jgi:hypothetical protein
LLGLRVQPFFIFEKKSLLTLLVSPIFPTKVILDFSFLVSKISDYTVNTFAINRFEGITHMFG